MIARNATETEFKRLTTDEYLQGGYGLDREQAEELADILFYLEKLKNLQKRDKEKQRWRKLFNSPLAVFIAGLFFALGIAVWF